MRLKNIYKLIILYVIVVILIFAYLFYKMRFDKPLLAKYQFDIRIIKLVGICIAGFLIGAASIVFQSVIQNNVVTPCLLGMNALYTLIQTIVVFMIGSSSIFFLNNNLNFTINLLIMVVIAYIIYGIMFKKTNYNILYILLIGTVLSSLFGSIQSSIVRIMDPNEYDTLLTSLTASFDNINSSIIIISIILSLLTAIVFYKDIKLLNVITLGKQQAINLGVDYDKTTKRLLIAVIIYIAIATAMVGPISFLGLITANLARQIFKTYKHKYLILGTIGISIIVLLSAQTIVERKFNYSIPISVFITLGGGIYFLFLILKEGRKYEGKKYCKKI